MKCPYCGHPDTRVIDSRPAEDRSSIRRRRSCDECGKRFTTYEKVETIPLIVIKKDNNREQYDRAKIETGILRACYKRPVSADAIQKTVNAVETEVFNRGGKGSVQYGNRRDRNGQAEKSGCRSLCTVCICLPGI